MLPNLNTRFLLCFLWIAVVYIYADLPKIIKMSPFTSKWLDTELGYTPDFSSALKFDIMARADALLELIDENNSVFLRIAFHYYFGTRSYVHWVKGNRASIYSRSILSQTRFKSFKIEYKNMAFGVYTVVGNQWSRILFLQNITNLEPNRVRLRTRWSTVNWIFHHAGNNTEKTQWKTHVSLMNIKFLDSVLWTQDVMNNGICAILCSKDEACVSYNFNPETRKCQGHLINYYYTTGRDFIQEVNAIHYYTEYYN